MRPLHDLYSASYSFEYLIQVNVDRLKKHRKEINAEKDVTKIKDILKTLDGLENNVARYKEWAKQEVEALEETYGRCLEGFKG